MGRHALMLGATMKLIVGCLAGIVLVLLAVAFRAHTRRSAARPTTNEDTRVEPAEIHLNTMLIGGTYDGREALTRALLIQCHAKQHQAGDMADGRTGVSERYVELVVGRHHISQIAPPEDQHPHSLLLQAAPMDGVVLMTSPTFGLSPSAREQAILLAAAGVHQFLVLVEGTTGEPSAILEARLRAGALSLLGQSGRAGQDVFVVVGGAAGDVPLTARRLLQTTATKLTGRHRDAQAPFKLTVEDVFRIRDRGTIATGMVERGTLHVRDQVAVLYRGTRSVVECQGIETFRKQLSQARAGHNIGVLLGSLETEAVGRGAVLAAPEGLKAGQECRGSIRMLRLRDNDEAPRLDPPWKGNVIVGAQDVEATVRLSAEPGDGVASNGETKVVVTTVEPVAMEGGDPLVLLKDGRSIAVGLVTQ